MNNLSSNDLQIFREKSRTFCGSVKIPLDKICHEELPYNPRQFNEKNVTTLLGFFRTISFSDNRHKEMTRYLRRIKSTWTGIVGDEEADQLQLDANTVAILQGRCPSQSSEDRAHVQIKMLAGDILPAVTADHQRSRILDRACSIEHVIPFIHTFLEDTKYLEPPARILKELLPGKCKGSMSQYFSALYSGQTKVKVQTSEFTFEDRILPSGRSAWLSYRQLWLFALRQFRKRQRFSR